MTSCTLAVALNSLLLSTELKCTWTFKLQASKHTHTHSCAMQSHQCGAHLKYAVQLVVLENVTFSVLTYQFTQCRKLEECVAYMYMYIPQCPFCNLSLSTNRRGGLYAGCNIFSPDYALPRSRNVQWFCECWLHSCAVILPRRLCMNLTVQEFRRGGERGSSVEREAERCSRHQRWAGELQQ